MAGHIITNIGDIYSTYFGNKYKIAEDMYASNFEDSQPATILSNDLRTEWQGREVMLPVRLREDSVLADGEEVEGASLDINCCTVRVQGKRTIISTAVANRRGTVHEEFNVDDYKIVIKGVLIGDNRSFPDAKMMTMRTIFESQRTVHIDCALTDLFLDNSKAIVIESMDFPEVEGKTLRHRPFVLNCLSDFIFDLEY